MIANLFNIRYGDSSPPRASPQLVDEILCACLNVCDAVLLLEVLPFLVPEVPAAYCEMSLAGAPELAPMDLESSKVAIWWDSIIQDRFTPINCRTPRDILVM